MLSCKVVLIIISLLALSYANYHNNNTQVEVFTPTGFRISIEDQPGITSVEFHVTIRKGCHQNDFFKGVHQKRDGKWSITRRKVNVEMGSVINYWLLVVKYGRTYRSDGDCHFVKENNDYHKPHTNLSEPTSCKTEASTASSMTLSHCEKIIMNTTQAMTTLQLKVEALTKMNQLLERAIEKYSDARKLTLSGRIPPDDEALMTVRFILREKLDLEPKIVSAVKNNDNSITFEVSTLSEKFEILDEAKHKLMYSKIFITETKL